MPAEVKMWWDAYRQMHQIIRFPVFSIASVSTKNRLDYEKVCKNGFIAQIERIVPDHG